MADFLTKAQRSERMAQIRGKDTKPELALRRQLHAQGFRYRLHQTGLHGTPDLVFARYKAVVFVHGCFWHRHEGCNIATTPKSNTPFWKEKFQRTVARDHRNSQALESLGWRVFVVWECELTSGAKARATAEKLGLLIRGLERGGQGG